MTLDDDGLPLGATARNHTLVTSPLTAAGAHRGVDTLLRGDQQPQTQRSARTISLTVRPPWQKLTGSATNGSIVRTEMPAAAVAPALMLADVGTRLADAAARAVGGDVTRAMVVGDRRDKAITLARHMAMTIAHRHGFTYPAIGTVFKRQHTTVMHAVRRIEELAVADPPTAALLGEIELGWHVRSDAAPSAVAVPPAVRAVPALPPAPVAARRPAPEVAARIEREGAGRRAMQQREAARTRANEIRKARPPKSGPSPSSTRATAAEPPGWRSPKSASGLWRAAARSCCRRSTRSGQC